MKASQILSRSLYSIGICAVLFLVFLFVQLGKSLSYSIWYEDEVRETVRDMIKPQYLKP